MCRDNHGINYKHIFYNGDSTSNVMTNVRLKMFLTQIEETDTLI